MNYYYSPEVKFLLINETKELVEVSYLDQSFELPQIGPRPPYYYNPRYEHYYPVI
ncbi:hypothetical protein [Bacillus timonensis]|uniref:hypothetical protein n=1 Tax=Bacillus timonensis TaxID=1033734 RepID=UPI00028808ED|nr:hypothetical protein [Bacillus timonensis]